MLLPLLPQGYRQANHPVDSGLLQIFWLDEVLWSDIPTFGFAISKLVKYRIGEI